MQGREDFLSQFLVHLGTSAIMDLLLQMVAVAETDQIRQDIAMVRVQCTCPVRDVPTLVGGTNHLLGLVYHNVC